MMALQRRPLDVDSEYLSMEPAKYIIVYAITISYTIPNILSLSLFNFYLYIVTHFKIFCVHACHWRIHDCLYNFDSLWLLLFGTIWGTTARAVFFCHMICQWDVVQKLRRTMTTWHYRIAHFWPNYIFFMPMLFMPIAMFWCVVWRCAEFALVRSCGIQKLIFSF